MSASGERERERDDLLQVIKWSPCKAENLKGRFSAGIGRLGGSLFTPCLTCLGFLLCPKIRFGHFPFKKGSVSLIGQLEPRHNLFVTINSAKFDQTKPYGRRDEVQTRRWKIPQLVIEKNLTFPEKNAGKLVPNGIGVDSARVKCRKMTVFIVCEKFPIFL